MSARVVVEVLSCYCLVRFQSISCLPEQHQPKKTPSFFRAQHIVHFGPFDSAVRLTAAVSAQRFLPSPFLDTRWLAGGGVCLHSTYSGLDLIIPLLSCRSVGRRLFAGRWMGSVTFLRGHHPVGNAAHQLAYLELFY